MDESFQTGDSEGKGPRSSLIGEAATDLDRMVLLLLSETGLDLSHLVQVKVSELDLDGGYIHLRGSGEEDKSRVRISLELADELRRYLGERPGQVYLLEGRCGKPITVKWKRCVLDKLEERSREAGSGMECGRTPRLFCRSSKETSRS